MSFKPFLPDNIRNMGILSGCLQRFWEKFDFWAKGWLLQIQRKSRTVIDSAGGTQLIMSSGFPMAASRKGEAKRRFFVSSI